MRYRNIREASGFYKDVELHQQEFWQCYRNKCWPLYPHATEETRRRSAYTFGETNSPYGLLIALRAGKLEFLVESGKFLMKPGKILVIPPGSRYRFQSPAGNLYHKCVLMIKGVNLFSILETLDLHHPVCLESRETTALFLEKFDRMKNILAENNPESQLLLMGEVYVLLSTISLRTRKTSEGHGWLHIIRERLENNLGEPVQIGALAREFHLNPSVMSRAFKKKFGYTPKEFQVICRIAQAKYLLSRSDLSLKEIAYQLGYCNEFYFSAEFLRFTGRRPRAWSRRGDPAPELPISEQP